MNGNPAVSVVIPWCNRDELETTLLCNAGLFRRHAVQTVVVNGGGDSHRLSLLIARSGVESVRQIDLNSNTFNKSLALNIGVEVSDNPWIFTLDADIILITDIFDDIDQQCNARSYATIEWVCESNANLQSSTTFSGDPIVGSFVNRIESSSDLRFTFKDGTSLCYQVARSDRCDGRRAAPGLLLARREHILAVDGYNSELCQWGWEDDDMQIRLQHCVGLSHVEFGICLHLTHGDSRRALNGISRAQSDQQNFLQCCANYNLGNFQGTYSRDIRDTPRSIANPIISERAGLQKEDKPRPGFPLAAPPKMTHCGVEKRDLLDFSRDALLIDAKPSVGSLLIEALLRSMNLRNKRILHVGIGNSELALQFCQFSSYIDGVTASNAELRNGRNLKLPNYTIELCDKYQILFRTRLPHNAYDIIVDDDIVNGSCCRAHLSELVDNYSMLLAPQGQLFTQERDVRLPATDKSWSLKAEDLAYIADQHRMSVSRVHGCVYIMEHCKE